MSLLLGNKSQSDAFTSKPARQLEMCIDNRTAKVGVIGQGYVGFPLAQQIARRGFKTIGYDINGDTVLRCQNLNRQRKYSVTLSPLGLRSCDVLIVAVPTPTRRTEAGWQPDLSYVLAAVRGIVDYLLDGEKP
ncbi:MAG TPA: NAD(P)-binding domain-containing protein, partial [Chloroflexota bacterium]|nr:NAD(P)-binding domain-containing protein [Chloroflexota bacterium]